MTTSEGDKTRRIDFEAEIAGGRLKSELIPVTGVDAVLENARDSGLEITTVGAGLPFFIVITAHWEGGERREGYPYIKRVTVGEGQIGVYTEVPLIPQRPKE